MDIVSNDRIAVIGQSGSGKTVFIEKMIYPYLDNVVFWDFKWESKVKGTICHNVNEVQRAWQYKKTKILYRPTDSSMEDFEAICETVFIKGNIVFINDEVSSMCTSSYIPKWYGNIQRMGRSRGVGCWSLTQRPMFVPSTIFSEAKHMIIFRLNLEGDRDKLAGIVGKDIMQANELKDYNYYTYSQSIGHLEGPFPPIKLREYHTGMTDESNDDNEEEVEGESDKNW